LPENDDILCLPLDLLRCVEIFPHLGEVQFDSSRIVPAGQGICYKDGEPAGCLRSVESCRPYLHPGAAAGGNTFPIGIDSYAVGRLAAEP
jgi:hypothetical protein